MNCKQEKAFPVAERFRQESLLTTQTATDLRGICGNDRLKKCWKANETEQKRTQTNGKNHKKFQIPVGKDEVGGSNPPSSSRKSQKSCDFGDFSYFFGRNGVGQNVGQPPDAYGGGQRPQLRSSAAAVRPNGHPNIGS